MFTQDDLPQTPGPVLASGPNAGADADANLAIEELYSKYRKLQQQLEFLEVQVPF